MKTKKTEISGKSSIMEHLPILEFSFDKKSKLIPEANSQTADWINDHYSRIEKGSKLFIDVAIKIGEVLNIVRTKLKHGDFGNWLDENINFSRTNAYRCISLFNYRDHVGDAENLAKAYKIIEAVVLQQKEVETEKSDKRIEEFKKTGKKSEDWKKNTDDKKARQAEEKKIKEWQQKKVAHLVKDSDVTPVIKELKKEFVSSNAKPEKKEKIEQQDDPFNNILMDYLDGFSISRKIVVCQNIIKMCNKVIDDLQ